VEDSVKTVVMAILDFVDWPFCQWGTCLFVRYQFMGRLLWWASKPVED
jgi:hypothetical protein